MDTPKEYGVYLCLFEYQTENGLSHYWALRSYMNTSHGGDEWERNDQDEMIAARMIRFFELPNHNNGFFAQSGDSLFIAPNLKQ